MTGARNGRSAAWLVAGAFFMENLDATIIVTALPAMAADFGVDATDVALGISIYMLMAAVCIPISGWLADRIGSRTLFCAAIATFTLASVGCALSTDLGSFIAARALQGVGGAMMVPVGRLVVLRRTDKRDLIGAVALLTWPGLAAPLLGPPLGGLLTTSLGWQWIFLINVPLGAFALLASMRLVPQERQAIGTFDWLGFLLCASGCGGLLFGLEAAGSGDRSSLATGLAAIAASGLTLALAVRHLRRARGPLIDLAVARISTFAITLRGGTLFRAAIGSTPFLLPLMLQAAFGYSPVLSGLMLLCLFAGNVMMKPATGAILRRFGFRKTLIVNGMLVTACFLAQALLPIGTPVVLVAALLFVSGLLRSMQYTALNTLAFVDVPPPQMSAATTLFSTVQQVNAAMSVAFATLALRLVTDSGLAAARSADPAFAYRCVFLMAALLTALAVLDSMTLGRSAGAEVSGHGSIPPPLANRQEPR